MCEACKNEEIHETEQNEVELENRDIECMFFEPLQISTDSLVDIEGYNSEEFQKGIKKASEECGIFTAYLGVGMTNVQAYELILTKLSLEHAQEIAKMNNNTAIEVSKNQSIILDKNSL